ncbi:unnamed protein product [Lupinus luteus]|uniref:Uncharacterized protein n=1 Tax=Lupinus luteus TaxID=3873 RepID=A0AAV1WFH2_LUPLU
MDISNSASLMSRIPNTTGTEVGSAPSLKTPTSGTHVAHVQSTSEASSIEESRFIKEDKPKN